MWEQLEATGIERVLKWKDPDSGLHAVLVIDSTVLGPAAGGVRTGRYVSIEAAAVDAARLARAMTIKCALGGVRAGGGKVVVLDGPDLERTAAFEQLGRFVDELGGAFRTAGDLGTTARDLAAMANTCRYVHTDERGLADSVARGLLRCIEACVSVRGDASVAGLRVAVQGCGAIGEAVARALASAGCRLTVADIDRRRAEAVASAVGADIAEPDEILLAEVDVVAPCAIGGTITTEIAGRLGAWAVCGAANNVLASVEAGRCLAERGRLYVPDVVASAGAVIDGIGRTVMGLDDRARLIDALGDTARELLVLGRDTGTPTAELAERRALDRISAAQVGSQH